MITFEQTTVLLRIFDVVKAREFYIEWLGFQVDWEHSSVHQNAAKSTVGINLSRGNVMLLLSEHPGEPWKPGAEVIVNMTGIELLHKELTDSKHNYDNPSLENAPKNGKTLSVTDPFGNRLVFNEGTE